MASILWQQYLVSFCCMYSIIWFYGIDYIDIYLVTCQTKFMSTVKGNFLLQHLFYNLLWVYSKLKACKDIRTLIEP